MLRHFSVVAGETAVKAEGKVFADTLAAFPSKASNPTEKIKRAVLYEDLNATNRRLVFRPTKAHLINNVDLPKHKGQTLEPTEYLGVPSRGDYSRFVASSTDSDSVKDVAHTLEQCINHKTCKRNVLPEHVAALLRKSAEFGVFEYVYQYVTVRESFQFLLTPEVYLEALRIVALRVPSKSRDVKNLMYKLYGKCPEDIRREAALLYGLSQYREKGDVSKNINASLERLKSGDLASLHGVDGALATAAGEALGEQFDIKEDGDETVVYTVAI